MGILRQAVARSHPLTLVHSLPGLPCAAQAITCSQAVEYAVPVGGGSFLPTFGLHARRLSRSNLCCPRAVRLLPPLAPFLKPRNAALAWQRRSQTLSVPRNGILHRSTYVAPSNQPAFWVGFLWTIFIPHHVTLCDNGKSLLRRYRQAVCDRHNGAQHLILIPVNPLSQQAVGVWALCCYCAAAITKNGQRWAASPKDRQR